MLAKWQDICFNAVVRIETDTGEQWLWEHWQEMLANDPGYAEWMDSINKRTYTKEYEREISSKEWERLQSGTSGQPCGDLQCHSRPWDAGRFREVP
jgi:hypothetical protein